MPDSLRRHSALQVLVLRAFTTMIVVVLLLGIAGALADTSLINPIGIVILLSVIGALDYRRRGEASLWGNLGYSTWVHPSIYGVVALIGVSLAAVIRLAAR